MTFVISNPKLIRKNSLVGSFDLEMPSGLIIRGVMLLEKDSKRWVSFPSKEWCKPDGSKGYFPILVSVREVVESDESFVIHWRLPDSRREPPRVGPESSSAQTKLS